MKLHAVAYNNRKKCFEIKAARKTFQLPYSKVDPQPTANNPIVRAFVDPELGREGFTYALASGKEGTVHSEQVLEYNQDPMSRVTQISPVMVIENSPPRFRLSVRLLPPAPSRL